MLKRMKDSPYAIRRLDHVQVAIPVGGEALAEAFYAGVLGFEVLPKPMPLAARGGRWFAKNGVELHVGAEKDFRAAKKAHPALVVSGFDALFERLTAEGYAVRMDDELPEIRRCFVEDPFGNRPELIEG